MQMGSQMSQRQCSGEDVISGEVWRMRYLFDRMMIALDSIEEHAVQVMPAIKVYTNYISSLTAVHE